MKWNTFHKRKKKRKKKKKTGSNIFTSKFYQILKEINYPFYTYGPTTIEKEETFLSSVLEANLTPKPDKNIRQNENYRTICPGNMKKNYFYKILENGI